MRYPFPDLSIVQATPFTLLDLRDADADVQQQLHFITLIRPGTNLAPPVEFVIRDTRSDVVASFSVELTTTNQVVLDRFPLRGPLALELPDVANTFCGFFEFQDPDVAPQSLVPFPVLTLVNGVTQTLGTVKAGGQVSVFASGADLLVTFTPTTGSSSSVVRPGSIGPGMLTIMDRIPAGEDYTVTAISNNVGGAIVSGYVSY